MLTSVILALGAVTPAPAPPVTHTVAIRARRAETVANGTLEYAVILVEDGKIVTIGQDLPIERGIPILDLPDDWTVIPGLVDAYSRIGMSGKGFNDSRPQLLASDELYPNPSAYAESLEAGITTLGQYPAGNGIPGQAVAVRPVGASVDDMIVADNAYLKIIMRNSKSAKKMLRDGFDGVDDFLEKEEKNREKWEKEQEKKKKKKKSKSKKKDDDDDDDDDDEDDKDKDDDKDEKDDDKKKDEEESDEYVPLVPDPKVQAFMDLRDGVLRGLVSISDAADYLHLLDAIDDEEFEWDLRIPLSRDIDVYHVAEKVGEDERRVVMEPSLTLHPGTMRQRNLPAEFVRAGAKLALIPRSDSASGHKAWLRNTGEIVAAGLDPQEALRAMTLEGAEVLGLAERVGSLEEGKDANLVFLNGDPFEPTTKVQAVMLDGEIVFGEVNQ